jgi:hypothetical protein
MERRGRRDVGRTRCVLGAGLLILLALVLASQEAAAGAAVGVRLGYADVGDDVLKKAGSLGGTDLVGIHLQLDGPLIELEAAGEYVKEGFSFGKALIEGFEAAGKGDYEDIALLATARLKVFTLMILPAYGYVGGGLNVHWVDLTLDDVRQVSGGSSSGFDEAVKDVAGQNSRTGWHAVAGVRLGVAGVPISGFVEGRYLDGFAKELPESKSIYAGVSFRL